MLVKNPVSSLALIRGFSFKSILLFPCLPMLYIKYIQPFIRIRIFRSESTKSSLYRYPVDEMQLID